MYSSEVDPEGSLPVLCQLLLQLIMLLPLSTRIILGLAQKEQYCLDRQQSEM